ncbi:hypothetical protein BDR26DRAFT_874477 [Obelidium mucronatum]|nr:hypothetical protein BDR26DRAFT_874477 [Obelidium mucronatum]
MSHNPHSFSNSKLNCRPILCSPLLDRPMKVHHLGQRRTTNISNLHNFLINGVAQFPWNRTEMRPPTSIDTLLVNTLNTTPNRNVEMLTFPLSDSTDVESLVAACSPASFGFNAETVLDNNYRKALKLDASCLVTNFDVYNSGIVETIQKSLLLDDACNARAVLHKLNVYGPEGFFKAHVDTPLSKDMFGSLVVCLPVAFEGGVLSISNPCLKEPTIHYLETACF